VKNVVESKMLLNAMKQNDVMKKLAAWAAMLAVPTAITGIYGMNFANIPELTWQYGFYATMVVIAIVCAFLYWRFTKAGWL
jgi:magnesium transporter